MLKHRVIPALLMRHGGLVKTRRFADAKYVGDPVNAIHIFNEKEVDELMLLDIAASKESSDPDYEMIELVASECFMPLCYGGGIGTLEKAARIFDLGVEKICIQSAALDDISILTRIAARFGSQSVVVSVDVKRDWLGRPVLYESRKQKPARGDWQDFMRRAVDAGAGEVLLTAVDRDGEMGGYDLDLIRKAAARVSVPIIALGGAGKLPDLAEASAAGASALAAGAMFVFSGPHRAVLITYPPYAELERLLT